MTTRRQPPTRREHVEIGARLQDAREAIFDAGVMTGNHYARSSKAATIARKALKAIDALRCELDGLSAGELRGDLWSPTIYYGANREVRAAWLAANPLDDAPGGDG